MASGEAYLRGPVPALLTVGIAVLCIILSLIALLSTSEQFPLQQFSIVTIDTSFLFQDAIGLDGSFFKRGENAVGVVEVRETSASSTASTTAGSPDDTKVDANLFNLPAPGTGKKVADPSSLPVFTPTPSSGPDVQGDSNNGTDGTQGTLAIGGNGASTGTGTSSGTGTTGTSGTSGTFAARTFLGDMQLVFGSLLGAAQKNSRVGTGFSGQMNDFFGDITSNFGLQGFYALYMSNICDGEFFQTSSQRGRTSNVPLIFNTFQCVRYTMLSSDSFSGSNNFNVGGSILDFSNFNIVQRFSDGNNGLVSIFIAIFVLQILGILCLFLLLPIATLYLIVRRRFVSILISALIFIAFIFFLIVAVLVTATNIFITSMVNSLFDGLGVTAMGGGPLLALLWVNVVLMFLALFIWFAKWHHSNFRRKKGKEVAGAGGGIKGIGGGKAFPAKFLKRLSRGTAAGTTNANTPIADGFRKQEGDAVEYV